MGTRWFGYELVVGTNWSGYELVLGTSWLGYELAWYDLVRVRVDRVVPRWCWAGKVRLSYYMTYIMHIVYHVHMMYIHGGSGRYLQFPDHIHTCVLRAIRAGGPSTLNP